MCLITTLLKLKSDLLVSSVALLQVSVLILERVLTSKIRECIFKCGSQTGL